MAYLLVSLGIRLPNVRLPCLFLLRLSLLGSVGVNGGTDALAWWYHSSELGVALGDLPMAE